MIKFLDEVPMTSENSRFAVADITDIYLDEKNPRFASSVIGKDGKVTQKDIINHLVKYSNIKELMAKIKKKEGLFDEDTISGYIDNNNKLIVLEGNRRITSCKILLDNSLLSEENSYTVHVPSITNKLKENISHIKIIIYGNSQDAQDYIASKHTEPDILKWTPFEQYNYYYVQFQAGKTALEIADSLNGSINNVKNSIRDYQLFYDIFSKMPSDFELEKAKVLPLIKAFMPGLTTTGPYKLELDYDEVNLKFSPKPDKVYIYDKILLMLAEA